MSAIDTALSLFQHGKENRPWMFFTEIYGGTVSYIESVLKQRRGLDIHYFSPVNGEYKLEEFKSEVERLKPELVYIESISNPMLIVADVVGIAKIAIKQGTKVIIDNTFATPWLFKPLDVGADIVIHSATKYLSGHGNLTAGVLCGNDHNLMKSAIEYRKFVGHMLSPDDAYRLQTQIQSFELRFSQQCSNAARLADYLSHEKVINEVWYPGLKDHATFRTALKIFKGKGFGAMITFDFAGENKKEKGYRRDKFIKRVSGKIRLIPTLGDPHTILMPVEAVWGQKYPEPGMIRMSVGFEDYNELESTVKDALITL